MSLTTGKAGTGRGVDYTLSPMIAAFAAVLTVLAFHCATAFRLLNMLPIAVVHCVGLLVLSLQPGARRTFYTGLAIGLGVFIPQTLFFWQLFPGAALALWALLALWYGLFTLLVQRIYVRFGIGWALFAAPFLWTGLEYFRSELWPLRFSWLALGGLGAGAGIGRYYAGVYGLSFFCMAMAAAGLGTVKLPLKPIRRILLASGAGFAASLLSAPVRNADIEAPPRTVRIAGLQLEFDAVPDVLDALNATLREHPDTELFILNEYAFSEEVPASVRNWCKTNRRWLIAGGRDGQNAAGRTIPFETPSKWSLAWRGTFDNSQDFRNTAFVVNTQGEIVFTQAKSQPIQFFKDGLPATEQRLWNSPWGKIGVAICYDAGYRRITDRLVEMGAEALIIPAMDAIEWGETEHHWNARQSIIRATEYRLPVVRVASSGISQCIPAGVFSYRETGIGKGKTLIGELKIPVVAQPHIPWDRYGAPLCTTLTGAAALGLALLQFPFKRS